MVDAFAPPGLDTNQPRRVVELTGHLVSTTDDADLGCSTPCQEWDVRALINHMAISLLFAAAIVRNQPPPVDRLGTEDVLGPQFRSGFRRAAVTAREAFSDPDALSGLCHSPAGDIPGSTWINFPTWDVFVHGWDLAVATGRPTARPDELTAPILAWARTTFTGSRDAGQIGELVTVASDAPLIDQLVALFGRQP
jgi:uncharacterized protein (TIGR03086 family)